jgi:hypothetical protein
MDAYKKLDEVVAARTNDSPSIVFFPFDEAEGCTILQDQTKQVKISTTNKGGFPDANIQND